MKVETRAYNDDLGTNLIRIEISTFSRSRCVGRHSLDQSREDVSRSAAGGGRARTRPRSRPRRMLRLARAQRRRQDHHARDRRRTARSHVGRRGSARAALGPRRQRHPPAHRHFAAGNAPVGKAHRPRNGHAVPHLLSAGRRRGKRSPRSDWRRKRRPTSTSSRADSGNGWRSPPPSSAIRSCCFSTNRRPDSTRNRADSCGT